MTMELLDYGNLPLTVILKSAQILSGYLGYKDDSFMNMLGIKNKKLYSKMRLIQQGKWKKNLEIFREMYTNLEKLEIISPNNPINVVVELSRNPTIIKQIKFDISQLLLKFKNNPGNNVITEILVNVLIPKEKWIEINSLNVKKLICFYFEIFNQSVTIDNFEKFLLMNDNYPKYINYFSSKLKQYYDEILFSSNYTRRQIYKAVIFKPKYEEIFKDC